MSKAHPELRCFIYCPHCTKCLMARLDGEELVLENRHEIETPTSGKFKPLKKFKRKETQQ